MNKTESEKYKSYEVWGRGRIEGDPETIRRHTLWFCRICMCLTIFCIASTIVILSLIYDPDAKPAEVKMTRERTSTSMSPLSYPLPRPMK